MHRIATQNHTVESTIDDYLTDHELIVTTPGDVYSWTTVGYKHLFHSETKGILAAKLTTAKLRLLAISDGQGVLLYDPQSRYPRNHNLHRSRNRIHCLHYDGSLHRLFFTTSMRAAVQCFSTSTFKLLGSAAQHPSAPAVFTFSETLNAIVSASINPPLVLLTTLTDDTTPYTVPTRCSVMPVTAAAFDPHTGRTFALGFLDGSVAVYDVRESLGSGADAGQALQIRERGCLRRLHALASASRTSDSSGYNASSSSSDLTPKVRLTPRKNGNICLAFTSREADLLVAAGSGGKCYLIETVSSLRVRVSWDIGAPVSSLTLIATAPSRTMIAFGRVDGVITFIRIDGQHLADVALAEPHSVIELDCVPINRQSSVSETSIEENTPGRFLDCGHLSKRFCRFLREFRPSEGSHLRSRSPFKAAGSFRHVPAAHVLVRIANKIEDSVLGDEEFGDGVPNPPAEPTSYLDPNSPTKSQYYTPQSSPIKGNPSAVTEERDHHKRGLQQRPAIPDRVCSKVRSSDATSRKPTKGISRANSHSNGHPPVQRGKKPSIQDAKSATVRGKRPNGVIAMAGQPDEVHVQDFWQNADLNRVVFQNDSTNIMGAKVNIHGDAAGSSYVDSLSSLSNDTVIEWHVEGEPFRASRITSYASLEHIPLALPHGLRSARKLTDRTRSTRQVTSSTDKVLKPAPLSFRPEAKPPFRARPISRPHSHAKDAQHSTRDRSQFHAASATDAPTKVFAPARKGSVVAGNRPSRTATQQSKSDALERDAFADELQEGLAVLRGELRTQMAEQREWFEGALKEHVGEKLLELNQRSRIMKLELFRPREREKERKEGEEQSGMKKEQKAGRWTEQQLENAAIS